MTRNTPVCLAALLLLFAVLLGMIPAVLATDLEASASEVEAVLTEEDIPVEDASIPADSTQADEAHPEKSEWDFDDDWDGPRSDDGAPLTRNEIATYAAATAMGKTDCVTFPQYTSP